jgi:hypothetical protein
MRWRALWDLQLFEAGIQVTEYQSKILRAHKIGKHTETILIDSQLDTFEVSRWGNYCKTDLAWSH